MTTAASTSSSPAVRIKVMVYVLVVILVLVALPAVYLAWRLKRGGEPVAGGSLGSQLFGRHKDDWGPK